MRGGLGMSNKELFIGMVKKHIKRDGVNKLLAYLEKSDFYTAPASTRYHHSREGGLCEHSIEVFKNLVNEPRLNDISMETKAIVGLFHDFCKIGYYEVSSRNTKDENGKWIQVPYYTVNDLLPYGHGEKSVLLVSEFIELTLEEKMAIRWHMGGYEPKEHYNYLSKAYEEFPLAMELHFADMRSSYGEGR
jgi:hypothetical protein